MRFLFIIMNLVIHSLLFSHSFAEEWQGLKVCNNTGKTVYVAYGVDFSTHHLEVNGWWKMSAAGCEIVSSALISDGNYFIHAIDEAEEWQWQQNSGVRSFCVDPVQDFKWSWSENTPITTCTKGELRRFFEVKAEGMSLMVTLSR